MKRDNVPVRLPRNRGAGLIGCGFLVFWGVSALASLALVIAIIYAIVMGANHFFL